QITASGPTPMPKTTYLVNARRYHFDDWVHGIRLFSPFDQNIQTGALRPTGDREVVPLGYDREWSGLAKVTNRSLPHDEFSYQAVFNHIDARRADFAFRLVPDGMPRQRTVSVTHGLDWTHTLGPRSFATL